MRYRRRVGKAATRSSTGQQLAAIDDDRLPRHPAGKRRGEEEGDIGYLLGPAHAAEGDAVDQSPVELRHLALTTTLLPAKSNCILCPRSRRLGCSATVRNAIMAAAQSQGGRGGAREDH